MKMLHCKLGLRDNTHDQDILNADAIRLAAGHFDAVVLAIPSRHECVYALHEPVFEYALAMAAGARLNIILCCNLWDAWNDTQSDGDTPFGMGWYGSAILQVKELAKHVGQSPQVLSPPDSVKVFTALDAEPMGGRCPQKWLQNEWDESKRGDIDAAIHQATFEAGRVHYIMPSTTYGTGKSRYAASMAALGARRICWKTYRLSPEYVGDDPTPIWQEPKYWFDATHSARRDVRGLWVTHRGGGVAALRDGSRKEVLTVEQALSCPEDSFWYSTDMPALTRKVAG